MKKNILWIEDDLTQDKEMLLQQMNKDHRLIAVVHEPPTNISTHLESEESLPWDGYLVDYNLRTNPGSGQIVPISGTAMIDEIRKKEQNAPIFLVSNSITRSSATSVGENSDYFFAHKDFAQDNGASVGSAFSEYFRVQRLGLSADDRSPYIRKVTRVPKESKDHLEKAFPNKFRLSVLSNVLNEVESTRPEEWLLILQWLRFNLFRHPGPLYDSLYTASMMGLTEDALLTHANDPIVTRAAYNGVFSTLEPQLHWWPAVIRTEFVNWCSGRGTDPQDGEIAEYVLEFLGAESDQLADCHVCGESMVNTVVVDRDDASERYAAHISCTTVDSSDTSEPGFELPRYSLDD